jgi:transcriptional regulator with GAF, ATPase, and Fis domain
LRALQETEICPVGATRPIRIDVGMIAATKRNLEEDVQKVRFRKDLYFRLNVVTVKLPRERMDDLEELKEISWWPARMLGIW